jgi:hypothetical protein
MTNPTTPFGWQMPTSTDLVTDLPADFETFGQAVATSMADLLGGTTGQVLAKASNTNMDFTWVAQDDSNAIQNAIVDAKGDLIAASANDTPARLSVGANGETLVADSSTSTGLRYQGNYAAGKNKILNSDYSIWQRGTTFTNPGNTGSYTADRYVIAVNAATTSHTVSQQSFTPGAAPVAGYEAQYFYRSLITTPGSCTVLNIQNRIEDVRTFAGQTVTFSFFAKADTTRAVSVDYYQTFGSGGSGTVAATLLASTNLTTGWVRYSATVTLPSISGKTIGTGSYLGIVINQTVTAGSTLDIWGLQLEAANTATAFQTATGTLQGELAACQRYYYRVSGADASVVATGIAANTTLAAQIVQQKVTLRVPATAVDFSSIQLTDTVSAYAATNCVINTTNTNNTNLTITVASGLTAYRPYNLLLSGASGYLGLSAEL